MENILKGKKIIFCVTGSIAAYKSVFLLRLLVKEGAEVRVIMTRHAADFVSPLTFSTLSGQRVMVDLFEDDHWENHALLGRWADLMVIAPLTAHTIGKMAHGFCDNLLLAVYLSATCPVLVAPAMDEDMWLHPSVKRNIALLRQDGAKVMDVADGELASGLSGPGRMAEPHDIIKQIKLALSNQLILQGKRVLITSGPTRESIDPVRYITNHSTGKMGVSIANAFAAAGADVTLVTGPTNEVIDQGILIRRVITADEMFNCVVPLMDNADIMIMAAAVADYTPAVVSAEKIKKAGTDLQLTLKPTRDILAEAGKRKKIGQLLIGFALETGNEKENARQKLINKNADMIILNSLKDQGAGFGVDTNKITLLERNGHEQSFPLKSKKELAVDILSAVDRYLQNKNADNP